jgi:hypothetical protein
MVVLGSAGGAGVLVVLVLDRSRLPARQTRSFSEEASEKLLSTTVCLVKGKLDLLYAAQRLLDAAARRGGGQRGCAAALCRGGADCTAMLRGSVLAPFVLLFGHQMTKQQNKSGTANLPGGGRGA